MNIDFKTKRIYNIKLSESVLNIKRKKKKLCQIQCYRRVFGLIRLDFACDVPSRMCNAVRSSGEMRLKQIGFLVGDVNDFKFSLSMSNRIFSFLRRRSSSFQSRCFRIRHGSEVK